jgi:FMN-dependent NADH-azoreductase
MNILHITCSPRGSYSASTKLSEFIVERLRERAPRAQIIRRDLGLAPLPHADDAFVWAVLGRAAEIQSDAFALSDTLIEELESAACIVIGTPMHNFTVPSALKAWIDQVVRIRRTFQSTPDGKIGLLPDRPVMIAVASGGHYAGDAARQPDFLTPYLEAILATIGLRSVRFFPLQGLSRGAEVAAAAWAQAEQNVRDHAARLPLGAPVA